MSIKLKVQKDNVLDFLCDEDLSSSIKVKERGDEWTIYINDPFVSDTKKRFGISNKVFEDGERIIFNGWKSTAQLGDDYHGDFFKFIKLYKQFDNYFDAKNWFYQNYVFNNSLRSVIPKTRIKKVEKEVEELYWDDKFEKLSFKKKTHKPYIKYLTKRAVSMERIKSTKIFIDKKTSRLIFPIYKNDELIFYTKRSIVPHFLPWIKASKDNVFPLWNYENISSEEIWLFEGIFDAIQVNNGVAILGVAHEEIVKDLLARNFNKYIIVLDNDIAGRSNKYKIAQDLFDAGKNVFIYNYKGISDAYKDFGELAINKIPFDFDNRIVHYDLKTKTLIKLGKVK